MPQVPLHGAAGSAHQLQLESLEPAGGAGEDRVPDVLGDAAGGGGRRGGQEGKEGGGGGTGQIMDNKGIHRVWCYLPSIVNINAINSIVTFVN